MKVILSMRYWVAICLFAVSTAGSASIWAPTGNVASFFETNLLGQKLLTGTFGIFDDTAVIGISAPVVQFTGVDSVAFVANGSNYDVSTLFSGEHGQLAASNKFQVGYSPDAGVTWKSELLNSDEVVPYIYLGFGTGAKFNNVKWLVATGIAAVLPTDGDPISAVPLPASVWMMTSALLGLLYLGRGKSSATA